MSHFKNLNSLRDRTIDLMYSCHRIKESTECPEAKAQYDTVIDSYLETLAIIDELIKTEVETWSQLCKK